MNASLVLFCRQENCNRTDNGDGLIEFTDLDA